MIATLACGMSFALGMVVGLIAGIIGSHVDKP